MIKFILRQNGITLADFAQSLNISRPTLNNYIKIYESNERIPNEKYQILFDNLFGDVNKTKTEFSQQLHTANFLIERDNMLGTMNLNPDKTDTLSAIIESCKQDLYRDDCDMNLYSFISMFLNSYYSNTVFQHLVTYFLTLNGVTDVKKLSETDKVAVSNYFRLFKNEVDNNLRLDSLYLQLFYDRVEEINQEKKSKENEIKKHLEVLVTKKMRNLVHHGIDIDSLNTNELIKQILEDL